MKTDSVYRARSTVLGTMNANAFSLLHPSTKLNGLILEPGPNNSAQLLQGIL